MKHLRVKRYITRYPDFNRININQEKLRSYNLLGFCMCAFLLLVNIHCFLHPINAMQWLNSIISFLEMLSHLEVYRRMFQSSIKKLVLRRGRLGGVEMDDCRSR